LEQLARSATVFDADWKQPPRPESDPRCRAILDSILARETERLGGSMQTGESFTNSTSVDPTVAANSQVPEWENANNRSQATRLPPIFAVPGQIGAPSLDAKGAATDKTRAPAAGLTPVDVTQGDISHPASIKINTTPESDSHGTEHQLHDSTGEGSKTSEMRRSSAEGNGNSSELQRSAPLPKQ